MKIRRSSWLLALPALLLLGGCALQPAYRYNANAGGGYYYGQSPYGNADTVIMGNYYYAQPRGWGLWSSWGAPYGFGPWGVYGNIYWSPFGRNRYGGYYGNRYYRTYGHTQNGSSQPTRPTRGHSSQPTRPTRTNHNHSAPPVQRVPVGVIRHRPQTVIRQAPLRSTPDANRAPMIQGSPQRVH